MPIANGKVVTVSSVAASDWVELERGVNRVYVSCATWSTTSVSMQISNDADLAYPCEDASGAVVVTSNKVFDVDGPGYIRMDATAYAANAVTMRVTDPITDRI